MDAERTGTVIDPADTEAGTTIARMNVYASGLDGRPWPAMLLGRPAVIVPQGPGIVARPVRDGDGWTAAVDAAPINTDWSALLDDRHLTVHAPGGVEPWFEGELLLTRDWCRAARVHRGVLLITGPFIDITEFPDAAYTRALLGVVAPVVFAGRIAGTIW